MRAESGRWGFVLLGFIMNLCFGAVYSYSIFKPAVEKVYQVSAFQGNLPYMTFLLFFAVTMFFGGRIMEKTGPRRLALIGGITVGLGWILSSFASSVGMLIFTYGVIAGSGVGLTYGCPIAMGARWFPDRKGFVVGLMVAGFGGSPLVTGRIANLLIGDIQALPAERLAESLPQTFLIFGLAITIILSLLALPFRFPTAGWTPAGRAPKAGGTAGLDFTPSGMVRTSTFWGLFAGLLIGCFSGLMAIGIAQPVGVEVIKVAGGTATMLVGVFAVFNALGRPLFGLLTDKAGPRLAAAMNLAVIFGMSLLMLVAGEGSTGLYVMAFSGFWMCLGGWLAIAPAATATFFGMTHYTRNYGAVFLAYGLGAIMGGIISGQAKDALGSYAFAFYPTAGFAALGFALVLLFLKAPKRE